MSNGGPILSRMSFPGALALAQRRESLDLGLAESRIKDGGNGREEIAGGVLHPADVRLGDGMAVCGQSPIAGGVAKASQSAGTRWLSLRY